MYQVYKVTSSETHFVYYSYCKCDKKPIEQFLRQSNQQNNIRKDNQYLQLISDKKQITISIVKLVDSEIQAVEVRNQLRTSDCNSFTGRSNWPLTLRKSEQIGSYKITPTQSAMVAREGYARGLWKTSEIQLAALVCGKSNVISDLDKLTVQQFDQKYFN